MNRRDAIRRATIALGSAISAPTLAGLLAGCGRVRPAGYAPRALNPDQFRLAGLIAERIIPATDTPGAVAAGVDVFIDMMVADFFPPAERERFLAGLDRVDALAAAATGGPFARARADEQDRILETLDAEAYAEPPGDPFFRRMKELTIAGYYTSEIGQTVELHVAPFGPFQGDVPLDEVGRSWA